MAKTGYPLFNGSEPNRASINIAAVEGAFPHRKDLYGEGLQQYADGVQVDATLPSYILQV